MKPAASGLFFTIGASMVFCGYNLLNRKLLSIVASISN